MKSPRGFKIGSMRYGSKNLSIVKTLSDISIFKVAWYIPGGGIPKIEESEVHRHSLNMRFVANTFREFSNDPNDPPVKYNRTFPVIGIVREETE